MYTRYFISIAVLTAGIMSGCQTLDVEGPPRLGSLQVNPEIARQYNDNVANGDSSQIRLGAGDRFGAIAYGEYEQRLRNGDD